jgi:hypothetical protein
MLTMTNFGIDKAGNRVKNFVHYIEDELLPHLSIKSVHHKEPVVVEHVPQPWEVVGTGNYAAVLLHPEYPDRVVKVYAPGRQGLWEEIEVYRRLGKHPSYSECYHSGESYLVLKRLHGVTLFNCLKKGIRIPIQAIEDIDKALDDARRRGLHPHDIHGKNVMLFEGRGIVVDISDFLKQDDCTMWDDLKKAYFKFYVPFMLRRPVPVPFFLVEMIRKGYRKYRRHKSYSRTTSNHSKSS